MNPTPVSDLLDLSRSTILVTGASGNIGADIARRLAEAGATLVLHYGSARDQAESLAADFDRAYAHPSIVQADLTSPESVSNMMSEISARGLNIDGVVNNAAAQPVTPLAQMTAEQWRGVISANLDGAFLVSRLAADHMASNGGGSLVNIASIEGLDPAVGHAHYAASKAGLIMLTRSLALEYGQSGVRANAVSPGLIDRAGLESDWPDGVIRWQQRAPLGRLGTTIDVADAVLFMLSPAASWISGANLVVDGGMSSVSRW